MAKAKVLPEQWDVNFYWSDGRNEYRVDVYEYDIRGTWFKVIVAFAPIIPRQLFRSAGIDTGLDTWYTEQDCPNWLVGQIGYHMNKEEI